MSGGTPARADIRRQLTVFAALLALYAAIAFATYALFPLADIAPSQAIPTSTFYLPGWQLGLVQAGVVLVIYGALGLAGFLCARRLGWAGIFDEQAGWRGWLLIPLALGLALGAGLVALDRLFVLVWATPALPHPTFPLSLLAATGAGIGEETLFRGFVLSGWALLLQLLPRRWVGATVRFWIANVLAALAFAAAHLPAVMLLFGVTSPSRLPFPLLAEVALLNGTIGMLAGVWYRRVGLVAAVGVHLWADIVWHVLWPLMG